MPECQSKTVTAPVIKSGQTYYGGQVRFCRVEFRFYVPIDTLQFIFETIFPANHLLLTGASKQNQTTTKVYLIIMT